MKDLSEILYEAHHFVSVSFLEKNKLLFEREHLKKLASRLQLFYREGPWENQPPPYFDKECTPPLKEAYRSFEDVMKQWNFLSHEGLAAGFADAMEKATIKYILVLMGQRLTPGSYTDEQAIPPLRQTLLSSSSLAYNNNLTVAGREWSKHTQRSQDLFWGVITGNDAYKSETGMSFIEKILNEATWWNVFGHFKHNTVFEARLPSGHGARWGHSGHEFIGFLEPFLQNEEENF